MKVFDLQCANRHAFEGWFGSEDDYQSQHARAMVACPFCGNQEVTKKLSAPRLNLSGNHAVTEQPVEVLVANNDSTALTAAWLAAARHVLANSTDVGGRLARKVLFSGLGADIEVSHLNTLQRVIGADSKAITMASDDINTAHRSIRAELFSQ